MVSIIIPVFNAENYLKNCIDSIFNQDYKDFEIILIDDGSTDKSNEIAISFASEKDNVSYYYQNNCGAAVARNVGIEHARGDYIMFVDADDALKNNIISELMFYAETKGYDIVACSCIVFDRHSEYKEHFFDNNYEFNKNNKEMLFEQLIDLTAYHPGKVTTAIGVPWGKLYRRKLFNEYKLRFDPNLRRAQDNIFNMYAFELSERIFYLDKCLYLYRKDHISTFKNTNEQLYQVIEARNNFFKIHTNCYTEKIKDMTKNEVMFYLFISLYRMFSEKQPISKIRNMVEKPLYDQTINSIYLGYKWHWLAVILKKDLFFLLKIIFKIITIIKKIKV